MDSKYRDYLDSDAWQQKRLQRLAISKFRCAACGSKRDVQVHHLTYARIFKEEMADLLPLCERHHRLAERLVKSGELSRSDDVLFLASETIRLLADPAMPVDNVQRTSNAIQEDLMRDPWFMDILMLPRKDFKKAMKKRFGKDRFKVRIMCNAFVLYDRSRSINQIPHSKDLH